MIDKREAAKLGEPRRDARIPRTTASRCEQVQRAELRFLEALRAEGEATADNLAEDVALKYPHGGKWVGATVNGLIRDRLIHEIRGGRSCRPHRHRGRIGVYAAADLAAVDARISMLRVRLAALDAYSKGIGPATAIAEPTENQAANPTIHGEKDDGPTV